MAKDRETTPERSQRRDHLVKAGLLLPPRIRYEPGRRGRRALWPADTEAREAIIRDYLAKGYGYQLAAGELILLGLDPPLTHAYLARNFLVGYCLGWTRFVQLPLRQESQVAAARNRTTQRAYIQRRVTKLSDRMGIPQVQNPDTLDARDMLFWLLCNERGIAPSALHGLLLPGLPPARFDAQAELLADSARVSDQRIMWALAEARTNAIRLAPQLLAFLMNLPGFAQPIPEAEWARTFLIGHGHCTTQHTLAQAMLPRLAAQLATDPSVFAGETDDLRPLIESALSDLGGLFSGYLGS